ncbi:helix-turn-helix transcriptional regulator [Nocardia inohanensis]|uniref:helix-turn-helix transcriptional regulator n=1 Tax=Nocardia inohanensis TaxID=209246 RepID=UPI00082FCA23|nr:AraC family transcriptional regulator [Nocardia inohanensis]
MASPDAREQPPSGVSGAIPIERTEVRARDPESGVEVVKSLVIDHRARITVSAPERLRVEVRSATTAGLGVDLLRFSGIGYEAEGEPSDSLIAAVLVAGRGRLLAAKQELALGAGGMLLAPTDGGWSTGLQDMVYLVVRFAPQELTEHAAELCDVPGGRVLFHGIAPLAGAGRAWSDTSTFLYRQLMESGTDSIDPLLLGGLKRLTAAALLATFPNSTMTQAHIPGPGHTAPAVIRRAVRFIDEHAGEPLTLARIAAEVRVSPRGLQAGFRRHLDTTPLRYLRRVRLAGAHRELRAADPGTGETVEIVAARWGFAHPARFAAWYRQEYGVPPGHTLRG